MERKVGTVSRGIRTPIIREGENLAQIVATSVVEAAEIWSATDSYGAEDRRADVVGEIKGSVNELCLILWLDDLGDLLENSEAKEAPPDGREDADS